MPFPVAPGAQIKGQSSWAPFDTSGVAFDFTKLDAMPASLYETEGYKERLSEEHGWEVQRVFRCNWSDLAQVMQWLLGYSFMGNQRGLNTALPGPNGLPVLSGLPAGAAGALSRVIPAQDWYRPYLYCDQVELISCEGVPLQDPGLYLADISGKLIGGSTLSTGPAPDPADGVGPGPDQGPFEANVTSTFVNQPQEFLLAMSAQIDWGDDTQSAGTVAYGQDPGTYVVTGTHNYAQAGEYTVAVTIDSPDFSAVQTESVTVGPDGLAKLPDGAVRLPGLVFAEQRETGVFLDGVATLRATYRPRPYIVRNDAQNNAYGQGEIGRYVERIPRYAIQGMPLANIALKGGLKLIQSQILVPEAGVMLVPTASWIYRWRDVPFYPREAILNCVGKVNSAEFDGIAGWPPFPAQNLLCQAPEIRMKRNACGQPAFDIDWILDYRPSLTKDGDALGWNAYPNATGDFEIGTFGGGAPAADGSNLVFKPTDFGQLFAVGETFAFG